MSFYIENDSLDIPGSGDKIWGFVVTAGFIM